MTIPGNCTPISVLDSIEVLFYGYKGKVTRTDEYVKIESNNEIAKDKKIPCEVKVGKMKCKEYPYYCDGSEKTCSILGGCGCPCKDAQEVKEQAERLLKRYKFEKENEVSLFDFAF